MNIDTGHLVRTVDPRLRDLLVRDKGYEPLPGELAGEAEAELQKANADETHVNLQGNSPLAKWAKARRRARRKAAAASRRRNRR